MVLPSCWERDRVKPTDFLCLICLGINDEKKLVNYNWCNEIQFKKMWNFYNLGCQNLLKYTIVWLFFFFFLSATSAEYGSSQARGTELLACATATATWDSSCICYLHSQLTHWTKPGMEPMSSWILVRFINHWAMMGTPIGSFLKSCSLWKNSKPYKNILNILYTLVKTFTRIH